MSRLRERFDAALRAFEDGTFRTFIKNTGWLTGSSAAIIALQAVQGILTVRILGVELWGSLAIAIGFVEVVGRLMSFQMNDFVVKWVTHFREDRRDQAATSFKFALAGDAGSALTAFVIVEALSAWGAATFAKNPELAPLFRSVALLLPLRAGTQSLLGMLQVNREFRTQGLIQAGATAASVAGMAIVWAMKGGMTGVVAVMLIAAALQAVFLWRQSMRAARVVLGAGWLRLPLVKFDGLGKEMWNFAILNNLRGTLATIMNDGDLLILGYFANPTQAAYYKLAKSIVQIASLPRLPLLGAAYPEFANAAAAGKWGTFRSLLRRGTKVSALYVVPVSIGLLILARPAIAILYGTDLLPAIPVLAILLVGVVVDGIVFWGAPALLSLGEPGYITGATFWATVTKLGLAFLLVPKGGSPALAVAQSIALVGMNAAVAWHTYAILRRREAMGHA